MSPRAAARRSRRPAARPKKAAASAQRGAAKSRPRDEGVTELMVLSESHGRVSQRLHVAEALLAMYGDPERVDDHINSAMDLAMDVIPSEAGSILLLDRDRQELYFATTRGPVADEIRQFRVPVGQGLAGTSVLERAAVAVSDADKDPRLYREITDALGFAVHSVLAAPIVSRGESLGVLELVNRKSGATYPRHEVDMVERVAKGLANVLALARRLRGVPVPA